MTAPIEMVIAYHQATKHHFHRSAKGPGYLDWANQPDPFRTYQGADRIRLPFASLETSKFGALLSGASPAPPQEVSLASIGQLFELSMGISAWKEFQGTRWALRVNPSSGNLHPTEAYLVSGGLPDVDGSDATRPMVCHYAPLEHALEVRTSFPERVWQDLTEGFPAGTFFVGLSSIHWREAWKYGERAFRYCQHDAGHAFAALSYSCVLLGWRLMLLDGLSDGQAASLLGLNREEGVPPVEKGHPDLVAAILTGGPPPSLPDTLPPSVIAEIARGEWHGCANRLSEEHVEWGIIEEVSRACEKPGTPSEWTTALFRDRGCASAEPDHLISALPLASQSARTLILQRRSAVAYDRRTGVSAETFYSLLAQTLPRRGNALSAKAPWHSIPWRPSVHLCLFVHLVEGIPPGLYVLARLEGAVISLREQMDASFLWVKPEGCPEWLDLYLLKAGDARPLAAQVSCTQAIAGDGAFSLGMVAEFDVSLHEHGPWFYRNLFWETGMIGQVLYLAAEAAGVRATGIGCFFDDAVHQVFGLSGLAYQSLYHFTLGGPVEDTRLTTLPPYSAERMSFKP